MTPPPSEAHPSVASRSTPIAGGVPGALLALALTLALWATLTAIVVLNAVRGAALADARVALVVGAYLLLSTLLCFATLMHLLARLGSAHRFRSHVPVSLASARETVRRRRPSLTVLVPSYREEPQVVRRTLLSAALLEYPGLRVVLLIDDPPHPEPGSGAASLLAGARSMPGLVEWQVESVRRRVARAHGQFLEGYGTGPARREDLDGLRTCLEETASELRAWAVEWQAGDHGDRLFADRVLLALAAGFETESRRVAAQQAGSDTVPRPVVESVYLRLLDTFTVRLSSFERKRYANLSHEPNKAMNLNAHLGLMGRRFAEQRGVGGVTLVPDEAGPVAFPSSDYVLTLDADSVLLPDYALRLVHVMEQPENRRVGVVQTPYSAFPGATSALERIAGATTDIQYLLHQGMTHYGATFWVGANAVVRREALDDIATTTVERGHPVTRYIQDRTVIEDTESSLDLLIRGWTLHNVPERLAYSATPPDFGSLVIQRRRWANGGLIILPKLGALLRARRRRGERSPWRGLLLQFHYLTSMPVVATGLMLMLLIPTGPLDGIVVPWLVPLLTAPYLVSHAADLRRNGYLASDTVRVFSMNMLLVAVNLAGGLRSLQQAVTGDKAPFLRTPKIRDRVSAPPLYILFPTALGVQGLVVSLLALVGQGSPLALYAGITAVLTLSGVHALVGTRHAIEDVRAGLARHASPPAPVLGPRPASLEGSGEEVPALT